MKELVVALVVFAFSCQLHEESTDKLYTMPKTYFNQPEDLKSYISIDKTEVKDGKFSYKIRFDAKQASGRDQERAVYGILDIRSEGETLASVLSNPRKVKSDCIFEFSLKQDIAKESTFRMYSSGIGEMGIQEIGRPLAYKIRLGGF